MRVSHSANHFDVAACKDFQLKKRSNSPHLAIGDRIKVQIGRLPSIVRHFQAGESLKTALCTEPVAQRTSDQCDGSPSV